MSSGGNQGRGGTILALGIIGILCCFPCGIAAWIMGSGDLKKIESGQISQEAKSLTQVGMYLGIASVVLAVLGLILQFAGVLTIGQMGR
ncbi:MAG: hypothetical protein ACE5KM_08120 [Planctomycetaceae bacterium]